MAKEVKVNMVVLYSTHCPKCNILEQKLKQKNIEYTEVNDVEVMLGKGLNTVPWLEVNGEMMDFGKANEWVNKQ